MPSPTRLGLAGAVTAVATVLFGLSGMVGLAPTATAQPPVAGTLTVSPATGSQLTAPSVTTAAGCPAPANAYNIQLTGPNGLDYLVTGRTTAGFSATSPVTGSFGQTFADAAALDTPPTTIVAGTYRATLNCVSGITGGTVVATFGADIVFSSPTAYTTTTVPPSGTTSSSPASTTTSTTSTTSGTTTSSSTTSTTSTSESTSTTPATTDTTTPAAPTDPPTTGSQLAVTGAPTATLTWIGLLLCAIGALYLLAARRRAPN